MRRTEIFWLGLEALPREVRAAEWRSWVKAPSDVGLISRTWITRRYQSLQKCPKSFPIIYPKIYFWDILLRRRSQKQLFFNHLYTNRVTVKTPGNFCNVLPILTGFEAKRLRWTGKTGKGYFEIKQKRYGLAMVKFIRRDLIWLV